MWWVIEKEVHGSGTRNVHIAGPFTENAAKGLARMWNNFRRDEGTWFVAVPEQEI